MIPIRCFSCGTPIAQHWEDYKKRVAAGEDPKKVLDDLGLKKFCCRSVFTSHVEIIKLVGQYKKY